MVNWDRRGLTLQRNLELYGRVSNPLLWPEMGDNDTLGANALDLEGVGVAVSDHAILTRGEVQSATAQDQYGVCADVLIPLKVDTKFDARLPDRRSKIIIIDGALVITGSFNFSKEATLVNERTSWTTGRSI